MSKDVYITVKDHAVSGESFQLEYDANFDMLVTQPQPAVDSLSAYYKSDDYISHTDGKRNLFEKLYHLIKGVALKRKLRLINNYVMGDQKVLLDVGCGTGDFLQRAQEDGWMITGIEPNDNARTMANLKTHDSVFDVAHLLELTKHQFDVITLWHVLEHLPNLHEHIALLKSLLKPNGTLIIAVPNYKCFDASFYKSHWAAYDVPRHLWHFSNASIQKLFADQKMHLHGTLPMPFDAYYVSLLSEKYKSGWMNIFRASIIATISNLKALSSTQWSSLIYVLKND